MPKVSLSSQTAEREPESSKTDPEPHPEPQPSPSPTPEKRTVTDPSAALAELGRHLSQAREARRVGFILRLVASRQMIPKSLCTASLLERFLLAAATVS